eukprot:Phypoly_transcript_03704.p1 GENE.Phypoly_transcript_03704~~Phypoly_transcript_03704.p1  ORF type:complete len:486 (+),score=53.59 Phypoly_transcript_03704:842-2299(+)
MKAITAFILFIASVSSSLVPIHVLLTLTGNATSLQVTFTTSSKPTSPSVTYWPFSSPYERTEVVATPSDIHPFAHPSTGVIDYITSITIGPLATNSEYSYFVNGAAKDASTKSATFDFLTLPDSGAPLKIGIYGDLGAYGTAITETGKGGLLYWSKNHLFHFIIHNGDLAYNLGSKSGEVGNKFLTNIQELSASTPYIVTAGNHEFIDNSKPYYSNWFLGQKKLGTSSSSKDPLMYYSFDVTTKLHIVVISTEVYCEDHTNLIPQYEWLAKDLASVRARSVQPWILVFGHRQIYIGSTSTLHSRLMRFGLQCNDSSLQHCDYNTPCTHKKKVGVPYSFFTSSYCGYSIEQLFTQYKVDMYFAGHVHTYNRMFPISDEMTYEAQDVAKYSNPAHPVYVVSGAAGTESSPHFDFGDPLTSPTAVAVDGYSFTLLTIFNESHLQLEQNNVNNNKIVDSFWIEKDSSQPPWRKTSTMTINDDKQIVCDQ